MKEDTTDATRPIICIRNIQNRLLYSGNCTAHKYLYSILPEHYTSGGRYGYRRKEHYTTGVDTETGVRNIILHVIEMDTGVRNIILQWVDMDTGERNIILQG